MVQGLRPSRGQSHCKERNQRSLEGKNVEPKLSPVLEPSPGLDLKMR